MIDTVKIYCYIDENIRNLILNKGQVKNSYDLESGEIFYSIVLNKIEMSFSSNINLRVDRCNLNGYILQVEGSLHKILYGQNSYNGFYNLKDIVKIFKNILEYEYNIKLPNVNDWFLKRIDITKVFDLVNQENVKNYINILQNLKFPRKKIDYHKNTGIYVPSSMCTLKIYNKYEEFKKNDKKKLKYNKNFDIEYYEEKIQGYIRYECEIHTRKLKEFYRNNIEEFEKDVKCKNVKYEDLIKIWKEEFMKLYSYKIDKIVYKKEDVYNLLLKNYSKIKANNLYQFYNSILIDGIEKVSLRTCYSTLQRKLKMLSDLGVSTEKRYEIKEINNKNDNVIYLTFNPFGSKEREVS